MSQLRLLNDLAGAGLITSTDKEEIIKKQWETGESIEKILIEGGYISEDNLLNFISKKYRIPLVSLRNIEVDIEATYHIPSYLARKLSLIPVRRINSSLVIAVSEPFNESILSELKRVTDLKPIPLLARKSEIEEAINEFYREGKEVPEKPVETRIQELEKQELPGSFEKYIVGKGNEKVYKLARAFVKGEIKDMLIVGEPGTGKTFTLGAIKGALEREGKRVIALTVPDLESAVNKFRGNFGIADLREYLTSHDILLLDEIEFLQNKPHLQDEVEILLEKYLQKGHQVAVASLVKPSGLKGVAAKLISLLNSMIEVELGEIDRDMAMRYLSNYDLSPHEIEAILKENPKTFRDLEGILKRVIAIKKYLSSGF